MLLAEENVYSCDSMSLQSLNKIQCICYSHLVMGPSNRGFGYSNRHHESVREEPGATGVDICLFRWYLHSSCCTWLPTPVTPLPVSSSPLLLLSLSPSFPPSPSFSLAHSLSLSVTSLYTCHIRPTTRVPTSVILRIEKLVKVLFYNPFSPESLDTTTYYDWR